MGMTEHGKAALRRLDTPIGPLTLGAMGEELTFLCPGWQEGWVQARDNPLLEEGAAQLMAYFGGRLRRFSLPLRLVGTEFERRVWLALMEIPYGETRTYGGLAAGLGRPGAARAVGGACGRNPLPVIVPCHRVRAKGGMGGFAWGIEAKAALLALEAGASAAKNTGAVLTDLPPGV